MSAEKVSKASVHYGPAKSMSPERCGNCAHFMKRRRECEVVEGTINARDWCDRWVTRDGG